MKQMLLMKKPFIIMDDREPPEVEIFLKERGVVVIKKRLDVGDYIIGEIGIERKSSSDFLNSVMDGRIFKQVENLKESFEKVILIIEDAKVEDLKILRGTVVSLILKFGVNVMFSKDLSETCEYLLLLSKKFKKDYFSIGKRKVEDPRISVLVGFPGIGTKLAKKLLKKFRSLKRIFDASFPELKKIIGEKRARKILEILRGEGDNSGP